MSPSHLSRRGAVYAVRFRLPVDLAARLGMAELRKSLHTTNVGLARKRCLQATVWFRAQVERLRQMTTLTRSDLEDAARQYFSDLASQLDGPRDYDPDYLELDVAKDIEASRDRIDDLDAELKSNAFGGGVRIAATDMLAGTGIDPSSLDPRTQLVAYQLAARAIRAQMQLFIHQLKDPTGEFAIPDPVFRQPPARPLQVLATSIAAPDRPLQAGGKLGGAVKEYLAKKAITVGQSQHDEIARALGWLEQRLGTDVPLGGVTKDALRGFRDDLTRIDVTLRGRNTPFSKRLTNVGENQIKSVTSARYWKSVQALFAWCEAEGLRPDNPSTGLKIEAKKDEEPRTPPHFEIAELRKLFMTPLYVTACTLGAHNSQRS